MYKNPERNLRNLLFPWRFELAYFFVCYFLFTRPQAKIGKNLLFAKWFVHDFFQRHAKGIRTHEKVRKKRIFTANPRAKNSKENFFRLSFKELSENGGRF